MNRTTQASLVMILGVVAIRLGTINQVFNYIKPSYAPLVAIAGVILALAGLYDLVQVFFPVKHTNDEDGETSSYDPDQLHSHHAHSNRVGWFLVLPLFAVLLIAPPPLGSYAANRQTGTTVTAPGSAFPPMPEPVDGAIDLTMQQFVSRALYDVDESLRDEPVRLLGFVSAVEEEHWTVTRFLVSCCAADSAAIDVRVPGPPPGPEDTWVEVVGVWNPDEPTLVDDEYVPPMLDASDVRVVDAPEIPFEF